MLLVCKTVECSPIIADLFEAIANPNNGLIELRVAFQVLESLCCLLVAKLTASQNRSQPPPSNRFIEL